MRNLSQRLVAGDAPVAVEMPQASLFALPEKVLQFGTGVLLRGLPDYLINKANQKGVFNGRIVVVKSTDGGDITAFERQDGLYTVGIRGIEDEETIERNVVCAAISRVLSAKSQWAEVLAFAAAPELQVVISNTTEVGIQFAPDDIRQDTAPSSFPGKLLAVLYTRWQAFGNDPSKGLVIVPTELIPANGTQLEKILLELAHRNQLESEFIDWLETANTCCNSLVDRIVPGLPDADAHQQLTEELGYQDDLLTMSEAYLLWAIEGNARVREVLSFHSTDKGIFIQPDINQFRELKLRLLNGTHTLSCGLAFLSGFATVRAAMEDKAMAGFISNLMLADLLPGIPYPVDEKIAQRFAMQVLDRFRNPYIEHRWLAITLNYSAKLRMRVLADLLHYYERFGKVPQYVALGFAAYLLFMRATEQHNGKWHGELHGESYSIEDSQAGYFANLWEKHADEPAEVVHEVLANETLWEHDLTQLPGFADRVTYFLHQLLEVGGHAAVKACFISKAAVS
ncbi:tagaturonate reductase [Hymenobacter profundi]|uniref:Tagaturonate reductase n=1 Tax=Hymenobacter profundi TaxID=1982110 RepID=A0ABS6X2Y6_9BACT|nr:tagaturonate reductase [Hymenobacter profundi]MBW3129388.1 tagaturonate reductase [Hymenobacter profundi]